jgi:hypothetical protein
MGIMKEKLEAVMNEWNKEEDTKPQGGKTSLSKDIIAYVTTHPNSTATQITNHVMREHPDTPKSSTSSILKQLADRNYFEREHYFDPTIRRASYKYRAVSEPKRLELEAVRKAEEQAAEERLEKMRAQAEAARAAKAAKREERLKSAQDIADAKGEILSAKLSAGLSAALPAPVSVPVSVELPKPRSTTQEILDSLNITQARALYDELKKIFGG